MPALRRGGASLELHATMRNHRVSLGMEAAEPSLPLRLNPSSRSSSLATNIFAKGSCETMTRFSLVAAVAGVGLLGCATSRPAVTTPASAAVVPAQSNPESAPLARRDVVARILPQNVRVIVVENGVPVRAASGVVIGNAITTEQGAVTYIMTNAHVVAPKDLKNPRFVVLVDLPTGDTQEFGARLIATGKVPESDLAVLTVEGLTLEPAQLADDSELGIAEDVVVVAAPYGRSLSVSGGMVSQIDFEKGSERRPTMIKTDAAIGYGASGGGLFSASTGKLLGIVEGYRTAKVTIPVDKDTFSFDVPMPGETFAAPTTKIRTFLRSNNLEALLQRDEESPKAHAAR